MIQVENIQAKITLDINSVCFNIRHAVAGLLASGLIYVFIALIGLLLASIGVYDSLCLALIHAGGAVALIIFWRLGRWGSARFDSFGAALLLLGFAYRIHAMVDALFYGARIESIEMYSNVPVPRFAFNLLLKGELITIIGILLIACSWRLKIGSSVEQHSVLKNSKNVPLNISILVYSFSFMVDVLERIFELSFGALDQVKSLFFVAGIASIYFIAARHKSVKQSFSIAILLGLPLSVLALDSGMKEEIFFPLVPAGIIYWVSNRQYIARLAAVIAATVILSISQLYVFNVRELSWRPGGDLNISTIELIQSFASIFESEQLFEAFDGISSRVNMTTSHAITVSLADNYGFEPLEIFGSIPASFIPRIFWPGKPIMQPGAMHTARILGISDPISEIRSATAAGFNTELYLGGWWFGVFVGGILYGWLLAAAQKWTYRFVSGFGHQVLCFIALYWAVRFDEMHAIYAYTSVIFAGIFIWILVRVVSIFGFKSRICLLQ